MPEKKKPKLFSKIFAWECGALFHAVSDDGSPDSLALCFFLFFIVYCELALPPGLWLRF